MTEWMGERRQGEVSVRVWKSRVWERERKLEGDRQGRVNGRKSRVKEAEYEKGQGEEV